jgi:RHS repeat-associated protein
VAGAPDYQSYGWVAVPFGRVNVMGGNLLAERRDLDLDTRLGNLRLEAAWNSADAVWRFGFELSYDGTTFVDASGARHPTAGLADGVAIPGTIWVRLGARTLRTKGGLVHEFDAAGRLAALRWASGSYPRLEYRRAAVAGASRLVEIRQWSKADDWTWLARFSYDAGGRLVALDDRAGRRATFAWDAAGRLTAARDPLDVENGWPGFRYQYAAGKLVAITSSEGVRAEVSYEGARVTEVRARGEGDPAFRFSYRPAGSQFLTTVSDPLGNATLFSWDAMRRLLALENALGERSVWTWRALRPESFTGPAGVATYWVFADDDPVLELQPSGNALVFAWDAGAENRADPARRAPRRIADSLGPIRENSYDAEGRLVSTANGAGEVRRFAWNGANLLAAATDPAGVETRFEDHGEHGHPRRVERAGLVETFEYDPVGNLLSGSGSSAVPGAGDTGIVSRGYDADRNLARLVLGDLDLSAPLETETLRIDYRSDAKPLRIARPGGGDSEFVYDDLGRTEERRDRAEGVWRATRFEWDRLGRVTAVVRPNGMETRISFDAAGRRSLLAHLRGGALESLAGFGYSAGRLVAIADSAHGYREETYAYDAAGRPSAVRFPDGERLELGWDLRSRVVEERYVGSSGALLRRLRFGYDLADRETLLRDGDQALRTLSFEAGRLAREHFGNGLVREYAYAADALIRDVTMRNAAGALVERSRYEQGPVLASVEWHASTSTFGTLAATSHEHFLLAPLAPGMPGPRVAGFSSDEMGAERLGYSYDVLGNLARTGSPTEASRRTYAYDAQETRLLRIRRADGSTLRRYEYDEAGFTVARDGEGIRWDGAGRAASVGARASFRWDALGRLVESTLDGVTQRRLFGGPVRASASAVPLAIDVGALEIGLLGGHRYRHRDFRGNVKLLSDAQGRIVTHVRYGAYGPDRVDGAPDAEAGFAAGRSVGDLLLLGSRLYDPEVGRFLAPDPVFRLVNQYAYADGNPVWYWDPDGRLATSAAAFAIGVGVGGTAVGVAVIAVGAAGTAVATPLVLAAGVGIIAYSNGFMVGAVAPPAGLGRVAARVTGYWAGGFARISYALGPVSGALVGFDHGQGFAAGYAGLGLPTFPDVPPPPPPPPPPPGPPSDGPGREIDLRIEATSSIPSCSPAALASRPPAGALRWLAAGLALQALLLAAMLRGRRGHSTRKAA